jgi:hypothetical protein
MLGAHLHVRPAVEQEHRPARNRQEHRQRGPVDALDALDAERRGGERRPRRAGGDQGLGPSVAYGTSRLHDRGVRVLAHGAHRLAARRDRERRVHHLDQLGRARDPRRGAEQEHPLAGAPRALGDERRTAVRSVRVERDHESRVTRRCRGRALGRRPRARSSCRTRGRPGGEASARGTAGTTSGPGG